MLFSLAISGHADAETISERISHDAFTGIAIGGYDPLAYFLEGRAVEGQREIEAYWGGGYWRFVSEGNRAAFEAAPEIYAPAYGGYGTAGAARGVAQQSVPTIFVIHRTRLFLFHSREDVAEFRANPDRMVTAADAAWPAVRATLAD